MDPAAFDDDADTGQVFDLPLFGRIRILLSFGVRHQDDSLAGIV